MLEPQIVKESAPAASETKPPMSETEASWHETQAGLRAKNEAEQEGASADAVGAVIDASTEPQIVAGFELKPASQGTIFTLQAVARAFEPYAQEQGMPSSGSMEDPQEAEMYEIAIAALIFADARGVSKLFRQGGIEAIIPQVDELIWGISLEDAKLINEHSRKELLRSNALAGASEESDSHTRGKHHSPAPNS